MQSKVGWVSAFVVLATVVGVGPQAQAEKAGKAPAPACNAKALKESGTSYYRKSQWSAALSAYEESYACQAEPEVASLATLSACKSKNAKTAKAYFAKMPENQKAIVQQSCAQVDIQL